MAVLEKNRRGILFSLSVLLLGLSLLSLAVLLSAQTSRSQSAAAGLAGLDRAAGEYSNIQDEFVRILSPSINISVQNGTVSINQSLPISNHTAPDLLSFEQFEANFSDLNVSMNLTRLAAGQFVIRPVNASISAGNGSFNITPGSSSSSAGALQSYDVEIIFGDGNVSAASWSALSTATTNNESVHVRVRDQSYLVLDDFNVSLDKNGTSSLNISNGNVTVATVTFLSPAALQVQSVGAIGLKTSVGFSTPVDVEADDVLTVQSAVNKSGNLQVG